MNTNIISIISKLANNQKLTKQESEINERAIKKAKQNGFSINGQFNFETRQMIDFEAKQNTFDVKIQSTDVENILNRCLFLPNCQTAIKVPFVDFNNIVWGYTSSETPCTFDSAKMSPKRLSCVVDLSLSVLHSTNEDFKINLQKAVFNAIFQKVFSSAFSTQIEYDYKPSGIFNLHSAVTLTDAQSLIDIQKQVDIKADNAVWVCSPSAKAELNKLNTTTPIFENGKLLNSDIIFSNMVEDGFICYIDLSKFVVCEFGVMGVTIDNYTQKYNGVVRLTFEGYFNFDLADKDCISIGKFEH